MTPHSAAFDRMAATYDDRWTRSAIGRAQRNAVWRYLDRVFAAGERVLDLGCGTGEDAARLLSAGVSVEAIDSSPAMVRIARGRGIDASLLSVEELHLLEGPFDGAISSFGPLNCVPDLAPVSRQLARLVRRRGVLVLSVIGRFCLWETLYYLSRGDVARARRRWSGTATMLPDGLPVFYPTVAEVRRAFAPGFELRHVSGVGCCVPPSFVKGVPLHWLRRLETIDGAIERFPMARAMADHRLLLFRRKES